MISSVFLFALSFAASVPLNKRVTNEPLENVPGILSHPTIHGFPSGGYGPSQDTFIAASLYAKGHIGYAPPGSGNTSCVVGEGQYPVVLVPGTVEDAYSNWAYYSQKLTDQGLCVYTFNHNPMSFFGQSEVLGISLEAWPFAGDIKDSAAALSQVVDYVLQITGASKVDLVGHSQGGGALPSWYIKKLGGAPKVNKMVALAGDYKGTNPVGLGALLTEVGLGTVADTILNESINAEGLTQQLTGSDFMKELNDGDGPGVAGVRYTNIATMYDEILIPFTNTWFTQDGVDVNNIKIQDYCALDFTDHIGFAYDPIAYQIVENVLLDKNDKIKCTYVPPVFQKREFDA